MKFHVSHQEGLPRKVVDSRLNSRNLKLIGKYNGSANRSEIKCLCCGHTWNPILSTIFQGKGCPKCARARRVLSQEEVQKRLAPKKLRLLGSYKGKKKRHRVECQRCHYVWTPVLDDIIRKDSSVGCPQCLYNTKFRNIASILKSRKLILIDECVDVTKKTKIQCSKCKYIWKVALNSALRGNQGCPHCYIPPLRLSPLEVKQRLQEQNLKLIDSYRGTVHKSRTECLKCGHIWYPIVSTILQGSGCPECARNARQLNGQRLSNKLKAIQARLIGSYNGVNAHSKVKCLHCSRIWHSDLRCGCPYCARDRNSLSKESIQSRLKAKELELLGKYHGSSHKTKVRCLKCQHVWFPMLSHIFRDSGCPKCNHSKAGLKIRLDQLEVDRKLRKRKIRLIDIYAGCTQRYRFKCLLCKTIWKMGFQQVWFKKRGCPSCSDIEIRSTENDVRDTIERITGHRFLKCRPDFLHGRNGGWLELDGYCPELKNHNYPGGVATEIQGYQHYNLSHWTKFSKEALREQKLRDKRKRMGCLRYGVLLICIPYWNTQEQTEVFIRSKLVKAGFNYL